MFGSCCLDLDIKLFRRISYGKYVTNMFSFPNTFKNTLDHIKLANMKKIKLIKIMYFPMRKIRTHLSKTESHCYDADFGRICKNIQSNF